MRRLDRHLQDVVTWLDRKHLGTPLRILLFLVTLVIPVLFSFEEYQEDRWLLIPLVVAAFALLLLQHYHEGSIVQRLTVAFGRVSGNFAGGIEDLTHALCRPGKTTRVTDGDAKSLCAGLLRQIRDFAATALGARERDGLRATLAVPIENDTGAVQALRVWCHDQTHAARNYTTIPLYNEDGSERAGAPAAFLAGINGFSIVDDIREQQGMASHKGSYRSVASFSVPVTGHHGGPIAVVSIDANKTEFFDEVIVGERVRPHIGPVLAMIGLVLTLRRKEGAFDFPK